VSEELRILIAKGAEIGQASVPEDFIFDPLYTVIDCCDIRMNKIFLPFIVIFRFNIINYLPWFSSLRPIYIFFICSLDLIVTTSSNNNNSDGAATITSEFEKLVLSKSENENNMNKEIEQQMNRNVDDIRHQND
jgi:hypothetical protein